jgi:ubiquitin-conjugating enzyme E2 A
MMSAQSSTAAAQSSVTAVRRLQRDLAELVDDAHIVAGPIDDDMFHWDAVITGPEATPWEGAMLRLLLTFAPTYPQEPPEVKFATAGVFHPNVYADGRICLDLLKTAWSPTTGVRSLLISIQSLLADPNPASPANPEAAEVYQKDRATYNARVREFAARTLAEMEEDE